MSFPDFERMSLRTRLALMLSVGLGLTMAIGFQGLHHVVRNQIYDNAWVRLENRRHALAEFVVQHPGSESAADEMLEFRSKAHEDYFEVRDGRGLLLARSESSAGRDLAQPPSDAIGESVRYGLRLPDGHEGIASWGVTPLPPGDARERLVIIVARETAPLVVLEARIHRAMLMVALSSMVAAVLATLFTVQRGLAPVHRLARSAESIDPDGPRRALDVGHLPRELAALGEKLSVLLRRLFESRDRERRFTRSVAHELRTPLAEVRMIADVGAISESLDQARRALQEISASAEELQQIVDALLALARYESGQEVPQPEPVDLAAEVRSQLKRLETVALQRSLRIDSYTPHERWVVADAALLRRLLANLIGNAVSHAPTGSTITLQLQSDGPLRITNPAPQLKPEDVARLGERFYRVGEANGHGHAGLGLPLANAIATVSKLHMDLRLDREQHLTTEVDGFHALPSTKDTSPPA